MILSRASGYNKVCSDKEPGCPGSLSLNLIILPIKNITNLRSENQHSSDQKPHKSPIRNLIFFRSKTSQISDLVYNRREEVRKWHENT